MKKIKCAKCDEIAVPEIIREPLLFTQGMQVGGKYYKACPSCLHDIESGEDRQNIDVIKATNHIADAQLKVFWYDIKETGIALIYAAIIIVALVFLGDLFFGDTGRKLSYWIKGTDFYLWFFGIIGK